MVSKLRKILNIKQIGHTGTLDPMATGVLPVCVGKATRIIQYLDTSKAYEAYIKLGIKTDTYDQEGKIIEANSVKLDILKIEGALSEFQGEITQKPPIYSAVHYKGKRLYEYARANVEIEDIPERKVFINSIKIENILDKESDNPVIVVDIDCSGGTYIRSIANDLGDKLGYGATLWDLVRTKSGKFLLEDSHTLDEIQELHRNEFSSNSSGDNSKMCVSTRLNEILVNPVCAINLECCKINENELDKIKKGQYIEIHQKENREQRKIQLIFEDRLAAIAEIREDKIFPLNVFIE